MKILCYLGLEDVALSVTDVTLYSDTVCVCVKYLKENKTYIKLEDN